MRAISHGDLILAARAVRGLPVARRPELLARMLEEAHVADRYRKRLGRAHPRWGNGSLMARAMAEPLAPEGWPDAEALEALAQVIAAVRLWRARGFSAPRPSPM
ncbi:MAG: hypothetical protein AB7U46_07760 [Paenirhodobacter sp.]|uniref:DUF7742 family protein n=1 Tax=Paenirhodobacter sp. TaxID=1965326 RepID=UPI003D0AF9C7